MKQKRPLTDEEKQVADNLKKIWLTKKSELGISSQEKLAHLMGYKTQGAVTQYINGIIPLNMDAGFKFAMVLRVLPGDINPKWSEYDLSFQKDGYVKPEHIEVDHIEAIELVKELKPEQAKAVANFIKMMKGEH